MHLPFMDAVDGVLLGLAGAWPRPRDLRNDAKTGKDNNWKLFHSLNCILHCQWNQSLGNILAKCRGLLTALTILDGPYLLRSTGITTNVQDEAKMHCFRFNCRLLAHQGQQMRKSWCMTLQSRGSHSTTGRKKCHFHHRQSRSQPQEVRGSVTNLRGRDDTQTAGIVTP